MCCCNAQFFFRLLAFTIGVSLPEPFYIQFFLFQETDVTPDPVLFNLLQSVEQPLSNDVKMSVKKGRVLDFFINMAICNTVVISTDPGEEDNEKNTKIVSELTKSLVVGVIKSVLLPQRRLDFFLNPRSTPAQK